MDRTLFRELGWILAIKLVVIALIWWLFFSDAPAFIEPAAHILN